MESDHVGTSRALCHLGSLQDWVSDLVEFLEREPASTLDLPEEQPTVGFVLNETFHDRSSKMSGLWFVSHPMPVDLLELMLKYPSFCFTLPPHRLAFNHHTSAPALLLFTLLEVRTCQTIGCRWASQCVIRTKLLVFSKLIIDGPTTNPNRQTCTIKGNSFEVLLSYLAHGVK
jgi:hypothetical protein